MIDSSSKPNNVVPLFSRETSPSVDQSKNQYGGGSGDGGDLEQRVQNLEKHAHEISQVLYVMKGDLDQIKGQTKNLAKAPTYTEIISGAVGLIVILAGLYVYVTPLLVDSALNGKMQKIEEVVTRVEQSVNKNDGISASVARIEKTINDQGDAINAIDRKLKTK